MFWDWLKEWSPVFSFGAMVIFAVIVMIIDNRYRKELKLNRKLDAIIRWANECNCLRFDMLGLNEAPSIETTKFGSKVQKLSGESFVLRNNLPNNKELKGFFDTCKEELTKLIRSLDVQIKDENFPMEYISAFNTLISKASSLKP